MPNRTEARPAKAVLTYATGRLPLLRLFSTPLSDPAGLAADRSTATTAPMRCCQSRDIPASRGTTTLTYLKAKWRTALFSSGSHWDLVHRSQ
jgi:hypothetical protein